MLILNFQTEGPLAETSSTIFFNYGFPIIKLMKFT